MNDLQTLTPGAMIPVGETSSSAVAAQAVAVVQARYAIAIRNRRVWDQVRQDILKECRRPAFADNKSAYYVKPIGQGVEGLGIRFAEVAVRCMTNVLLETPTVYSDASKEIVRVVVTDLESNTTYSVDVPVSKTVERSKPMDDGTYISVRTNSYGKPVYTVPATDDDILNKRNALISKAMRGLVLRLLPGDIQDEATDIILAVRKDAAAKDPTAERKRIADAFASLGVKAAQLVEYLGHELDTCSPAELVKLRGLYGAISDGETTWKAVMENAVENGTAKKKDEADSSKPAQEQRAPGKTGRAAAEKARLAAEEEARKKADGEAQQATPPAPPADSEPAGPTEAEVARWLATAETLETLEVCAQRIQEVKAQGAAERLGAIFTKLRAGLKLESTKQNEDARAAAEIDDAIRRIKSCSTMEEWSAVMNSLAPTVRAAISDVTKAQLEQIRAGSKPATSQQPSGDDGWGD